MYVECSQIFSRTQFSYSEQYKRKYFYSIFNCMFSVLYFIFGSRNCQIGSTYALFSADGEMLSFRWILKKHSGINRQGNPK